MKCTRNGKCVGKEKKRERERQTPKVQSLDSMPNSQITGAGLWRKGS
jgi:hypothetical protein